MTIEREIQYDTDKFRNGLMFEYLSILAPLRYKKITLLEIGIFKGGSLRFWCDYFMNPESKIIGIDISPPEDKFRENVFIYKCDQSDHIKLKTIAEKYGPFDIIIDDGSHFREETQNCFDVLLDYVVPGGFYVIEDWAVGYWEDKPQYRGMVELITETIKNVPRLKIEGMKIILDKNKAIAFFRKGIEGWIE